MNDTCSDKHVGLTHKTLLQNPRTLCFHMIALVYKWYPYIVKGQR